MPRWTTPDPLAEKYFPINTYAYCAGDPVNYWDPEGSDLVIKGDSTSVALNQIQSAIGNGISLSIDDNGRVSYIINRDNELSGIANKIMEIINNKDITVNLNSTISKRLPSGYDLIVGAFYGTSINNGHVDSYQFVNVNSLSRIDNATGEIGKAIMHEITESYNAAMITLKKGVGYSYVLEGRSKGDNLNVYNEAHRKATPQPDLVIEYYDSHGRVSKANTRKYAVFVIVNGEKIKVQAN